MYDADNDGNYCDPWEACWIIDENENWKINFFEGVPSPAAAGLVLLPLILNLTNLIQFENYAVLSSGAILATSILMVSKIPTYSLKRIIIPRHLAVFLLTKSIAVPA